MDLRQVFATNLRRLRHAKGLSQEVLAYEADVNRTYMSKLEKGASYPGLEITSPSSCPDYAVSRSERGDRKFSVPSPANCD